MTQPLKTGNVGEARRGADGAALAGLRCMRGRGVLGGVTDALVLCAFCCVSHTPAAGVGLSLALILARMRSGSMASSSAGDWPRELLDSPPEPIACSVVLTAPRAGRLIYKLAVLCPLKTNNAIS